MIIYFLNNTMAEIKLKLLNGNILTLQPFEEGKTTKDNPITHVKYVGFTNFRKLN